MGLIVDTNVFIDAENGRLNLDRLKVLGDYGEVFISAITVSELLVGVHLAKTQKIRVRRSAFVERIISTIPILAFTEEVARIYAGLYAGFLKPRRKSIVKVHDIQIAATAITHGYAVLTSNTPDFKKIPGLKLETPR